MPPSTNYAKQSDAILNASEKSNSELLALMYGTLVTQVVRDVENIDAANAELERLGSETGIRLVEDFVSRAQLLTDCQDFKDTCDVIAKVAFKVFLGVSGEVNPDPENSNVCYISLSVNPLADFVEIPPNLSGLNYNAYICGIIQSALHQIQLKVKCTITKDALQNDETTEFRLELLELLNEPFIDLEDA